MCKLISKRLANICVKLIDLINIIGNCSARENALIKQQLICSAEGVFRMNALMGKNFCLYSCYLSIVYDS